MLMHILKTLRSVVESFLDMLHGEDWLGRIMITLLVVMFMCLPGIFLFMAMVITGAGMLFDEEKR